MMHTAQGFYKAVVKATLRRSIRRMNGGLPNKPGCTLPGSAICCPNGRGDVYVDHRTTSSSCAIDSEGRWVQERRM